MIVFVCTALTALRKLKSKCAIQHDCRTAIQNNLNLDIFMGRNENTSECICTVNIRMPEKCNWVLHYASKGKASQCNYASMQLAREILERSRLFGHFRTVKTTKIHNGVNFSSIFMCSSCFVSSYSHVMIFHRFVSC